VTTAPAATVAHRPIVTGATHTLRAPSAAGFPIDGGFPATVGVDGARILIVRQHRTGSDEHAVLDAGRFVHARVILDLAVIAHVDADPDVRAPPDDHVAADVRARPHLSQMPDHRAATDRDAVIDVG
jgi:hypothetical protein